MVDTERFVYLSFHVDTNRVNARTALPNMNQLEKWFDDGVILMQMSEVAREEAVAGGNAARAQKARSYIFSLIQNLNEDERRLVAEIEQVLFPTGVSSQNEANDVGIVFNAAKYGAILVTADGGSRRQPGGMLGNQDALARLGVEALSDSEAVALVRRKIAERDQRAKSRAERDGSAVPTWVGAD